MALSKEETGCDSPGMRCLICRKHGHKAFECKLRGQKRCFHYKKIGHESKDCWSNSYSTDGKSAAKVSVALQRYKSDLPDSMLIEGHRNKDSTGNKVQADDTVSARSKPSLGRSVSGVADSKEVSVVSMKTAGKPTTCTRYMPVVRGKIGQVRVDVLRGHGM